MSLRPDFARRINSLLEQEIGLRQAENEQIIQELQQQNDLLQEEVIQLRSDCEQLQRRLQDKAIKKDHNRVVLLPLKENVSVESPKVSPRKPGEHFVKLSPLKKTEVMNIQSRKSSSLISNMELRSNTKVSYQDDSSPRSGQEFSSPSKNRESDSYSKVDLSPAKIKVSPTKVSLSRSFTELSRGMKEVPSLRSKSMHDSKHDEVVYSDEDEDEEVPFHMVPTQYSDEENSISADVFARTSPLKSSPTKQVWKSPVKAIVEVIEDSEDEEELRIPDMPKPYTTLQRRDFLQKYYIAKFHNQIEIKINLFGNPINESRWIISDFKPNPNYNETVSYATKRKLGMTKEQETNLKRFHSAANGETFVEIEQDEDEREDKLSQMYDKFPSPPGFMNSEFPNTQESGRRRKIIEHRQKRRIERRLVSCLSVKHGQQVGEFIFQYEILNEFAKSDRWFRKD